MILVTGATGNVGSELVRELVARGVPFRAMVRKEADATALREQGVDAVLGDFDDPASLREALAGVTHVYLVTPGTPQQVAQQIAFVQVAQAAGVQHIVKQSALGAALGSPTVFMDQHGQIEQAIQDAGLAYTFLRPNSFVQNIGQFNAGSVANGGAFYANMGEGRVSHVDVRDIAAVAARVLTEDGHAGQVYELTGPAALSNSEIAAKLSALLGTPVQYVAVPDESARASMAAMGDWLANALVTLNQFYAQDKGAAVTPTAQQITGRTPRSVDAYLEKNIQLFKPATT